MVGPYRVGCEQGILLGSLGLSHGNCSCQTADVSFGTGETAAGAWAVHGGECGNETDLMERYMPGEGVALPVRRESGRTRKAADMPERYAADVDTTYVTDDKGWDAQRAVAGRGGKRRIVFVAASRTATAATAWAPVAPQQMGPAALLSHQTTGARYPGDMRGLGAS